MIDLDKLNEAKAALSDSDAFVIFCRGLAYGRAPFAASVMRPLERRGLFEREERKGFQVRWHLTPLGEALRRWITGEEVREVSGTWGGLASVPAGDQSTQANENAGLIDAGDGRGATSSLPPRILPAPRD